jgi:hypothetical protein
MNTSRENPDMGSPSMEGLGLAVPESNPASQPKSMTLPSSGMDDEGHRGTHTHDKIVLLNSHPHIDHSASFSSNAAHFDTGSSHGLQSYHVMHNPRGKGAEHHPPSGLMDCCADNTPETQEIF